MRSWCVVGTFLAVNTAISHPDQSQLVCLLSSSSSTCGGLGYRFLITSNKFCPCSGRGQLSTDNILISKEFPTAVCVNFTKGKFT